MPKTLKKSPKSAKIASKSVKQSAQKQKVTPPSVKLMECFMRDLSWESFLPPSLYRRENRDMDFHLAATVRPINPKISCVSVAIRMRLSPQGKQPFVVCEMIQEGVFNASCANKDDAQKIYVSGGPQVYEKARSSLVDILSAQGIKPPLPAHVDFHKLWQDNH